MNDITDFIPFGGKLLLLLFVADFWNATYNFGFDRILLKRYKSVEKSVAIKGIYIALFQLGLVVLTTPLISTFVEGTFWEVISADFWFSLLVFNYSYVSNTLYELLFFKQ
jgi:uncharacterized membrane protein